MREPQYETFLLNLIEKSKQQQIRWKYLDSNIDLCRGMHLYQEALINKIYSNMDKFYFDVERSYYVEFPKENMFIALIVKTGSAESELHIIPNTFKNVLVLGFSDYGDSLTRLANIIKRQFPNPEDFIASFQ